MQSDGVIWNYEEFQDRIGCLTAFPYWRKGDPEDGELCVVQRNHYHCQSFQIDPDLCTAEEEAEYFSEIIQLSKKKEIRLTNELKVIDESYYREICLHVWDVPNLSVRSLRYENLNVCLEISELIHYQIDSNNCTPDEIARLDSLVESRYTYD